MFTQANLFLILLLAIARGIRPAFDQADRPRSKAVSGHPIQRD